MRWVEHASCQPHHCAVLPFIGNSNVRRGFIDCGTELRGFDSHVYVSDTAIEALAKAAGFPTREDFGHLEAENTRLLADLEATTTENERLSAVIDAIDIIESDAFTARKKAGRPVRKEPTGV